MSVSKWAYEPSKCDNDYCPGCCDNCPKRFDERLPGEYVPYETRGEAQGKVDRNMRYSQIKECLKERPQQTAKEIAVMMWSKGYIPNTERNFTAPRLTEMCQNGIVEAIGTTKCKWTGRTVSVYELR